jgi:2-C-methyl-D-erythritol 4-phosphate cytidylyltransferase
VNAAIIVAGGEGERSGIEGGKQLAIVAGAPVLSHTIAAFESCSAIDLIIVVVHPDRVDEYRTRAVQPLLARKIGAVVGGGKSRQESVAAGIAALPAEVSLVAIHDGARPLVTSQTIAAALDALTDDPPLAGVVVGHPAYDTLKLVDDFGRVVRTVDRSEYWVAQTPQVFRVGLLVAAYESAAQSGFEGTDDAAVVESAGGAVGVLAGPRDNIKVTVPEDLALVDRVLRARGEALDGR